MASDRSEDISRCYVPRWYVHRPSHSTAWTLN